MSSNKVFNNTIPIRVSVANWDENTGGGDVDADISNINRNVAQVHNNGGGLINSESTIHDRMADSNLHLESIEENTQTIISKMQNNVDLTPINTNTTDINNKLGAITDPETTHTVLGRLTGIAASNTSVRNTLGSTNSTTGNNTILGQLKQTNKTLGTSASTTSSSDLFGRITTIRNYIENNNDKIIAIKNTVGSTSDLTTASTINGRTYQLALTVGQLGDTTGSNSISGKLAALRASSNSIVSITDVTQKTIGTTGDASTENTLSGKLIHIRDTNNNIASNLAVLKNNVGSSDDTSSDNTIIGLLKRIIENNKTNF